MHLTVLFAFALQDGKAGLACVQRRRELQRQLVPYRDYHKQITPLGVIEPFFSLNTSSVTSSARGLVLW